MPPLIREVFETKDPAVWVQKIKIANAIIPLNLEVFAYYALVIYISEVILVVTALYFAFRTTVTMNVNVRIAADNSSIVLYFLWICTFSAIMPIYFYVFKMILTNGWKNFDACFYQTSFKREHF
jgi:hypothetical protein